ncbi:alpha/beta hydrolase [Kitasatospora phosalacinea]|uniref:Alpha/beta hydrolase n=1 Tax=Kitasatospora phosalacinea TaxID=2065 RepID=A0A9W6QEJ6_9ACTN|nr:alpha/beta hydrolase [Kitasatospora phosalacinea]GLW73433.1 alpha/beta hydrolase [Kitasatospora phosalacinea]
MTVSPPSVPPRGVLLVHGAWHTGRAWDGVAAGLRARGVAVAVAELHRGSLAADTAAAEAALDGLGGDGPVVACGHSYGGAVITGLPPHKVDHLVYLAAMMPDRGETVLGLLAGAPPTALASGMVGDPAGTTTIDPQVAGELFHGRLDAGERAHHTARLVPQTMAPGHQPTTAAAWRRRPSTYVVCTEDRAVHPELQRRFAARATRALTWPSDHGAFASHARETVDLLHQLATRGAADH